MGHDPRLPRMPEKPTLFDFFKYRFGPANHVLQSARLAQKNGMSEKIVPGLPAPRHRHQRLHPLGSRILGGPARRALRGPEVTFAIRYHQVLRFYPDESVGYRYPELYVSSSAPISAPSRTCTGSTSTRPGHKWYMSARMLTVNDLYSFDPNARVELEEFTDVVGRHFRQPAGGAGLRRERVGAHVADHHVADALPLDALPQGVREGEIPEADFLGVPVLGPVLGGLVGIPVIGSERGGVEAIPLDLPA